MVVCPWNKTHILSRIVVTLMAVSMQYTKDCNFMHKIFEFTPKSTSIFKMRNNIEHVSKWEIYLHSGYYKNKLVNQMVIPFAIWKIQDVCMNHAAWCIARGCLTNEHSHMHSTLCKQLYYAMWKSCSYDCYASNSLRKAHTLTNSIFIRLVEMKKKKSVWVCYVVVPFSQTLELLIRRKGSNYGCKHTWNERTHVNSK